MKQTIDIDQFQIIQTPGSLRRRWVIKENCVISTLSGINPINLLTLNLTAHDDFHQAVKMTGEFSFELVDDVTPPDIIDDISKEYLSPLPGPMS